MLAYTYPQGIITARFVVIEIVLSEVGEVNDDEIEIMLFILSKGEQLAKSAIKNDDLNTELKTGILIVIPILKKPLEILNPYIKLIYCKKS